MSLFDEFDRLQDTVNTLMGDFSQRRGLGRGRQRRGNLMDPFGLMEDEWTSPLMLGGGMEPSNLLTSGKGAEENKMDESGGALTTQGDMRVGGVQLPTLRCRVNVEDQKDKLVVTAECPGFDKQNLKVNISDDNVLTISGEQKQEHVEEAKNKKFLRVERSFGSIQRQLRLPKNIDVKKVNAQYVNGILHIDVPKVDIKESQTPINIK